MAGVVFENVRKRFGDTDVIPGLDLAVRDEEFLVIAGPSGCGKSTVLRLLAGLEEVDGGTIRIGDRVVDGLAPRDRDVAMVFQDYALYPHMTVRENMGFALRLRKMDRGEVARRVDEAARTLGIADLLDRRPRELSGGQRQRVAVGRAIVRQPAVFLFDEPLSNLDATLRVQMRAEIAALQRRLGTTTIYVTHDQVEAMTMGHRIAVLDRGRLQQLGPPQEVYARPRSLFVAGFIGTPPMNLLPAAVADDGRAVEAAGAVLPVPSGLRAAVRALSGRPLVVGVRPEHIAVAARPANHPTAALRVDVVLVEALGDEALVHGRVAGADQPLVAKADPARCPQPGDEVEMHPRTDALHLFDGETGARLDAAAG